MSKINFTISPVDNKPTRNYRKGSKYDPVIDAFLEGEHNMVLVEIPNRDANYLRTQIIKRVEKRELNTIKVSVVNNQLFLEKI